MKKVYLLCILIIFLIIGNIFGDCFFKNPIRYSESPDPWALYNEEDGYYYLMVTTGDGVWLQRSRKLQDVGKAKKIMIWLSGNKIKSNVWAPELHRINDKWYIYSCGCLKRNYEEKSMRLFVLESQTNSPLGPYTYEGLLLPETPAIDPTIWQNPFTKELYIAWSQFDEEGQSIYIAPMKDPTKVGYPRIRISKPEYDWEKNGAPINEGPEFLYRDGKLFLIYSASGTWTPNYCLGMLTLEGNNPLDPKDWKKIPEPVFKRSDKNRVWGPGHCSFVKTPKGEYWIVYHAKSTSYNTMRDRSTRIQRFLWDENGFPVFGEPLPLATEIPCPK